MLFYDKFDRCHLNIAGIENYTNLQDLLPHCWSEPSLGNVLRRELEPPILQQAAFDDTVSLFELAVNICILFTNIKIDFPNGHNSKCWCSRNMR